MHRTQGVRYIGLAAALCGLGLVGCAHEGVRSTGPQNVEHLAANEINKPYIPAGTEFDATMDQPLGTVDSVKGQRFTATVQTALLDDQGRPLVPAGAKLIGTVEDTHSGDHPNITVRFDSIQTAAGTAKLDAKIVSAGQYAYLGPPQPEPSYGPFPYYSTFYPYAPSLAYGYGYGGYYIPRELRVPQGAVLHVKLTRPLLAPGSYVK